ncbi:MAG: hypothetical protein ACR2K1_08890 [Saprospiraceae bacterium]
MIVFQSGLALVSGTDLNADSPVVGYANKVTTGNVAATTAQANYPATNLANPATHLFWKGNAATATEDLIISGLTGTSDYVGIAKHNFGTAGIVVTLAGSTDGSTYTTLATHTPTTDLPIMFLVAAAAYTNFRIRLTVGATKPQAAVVYCGEALRFQRRIYVGHTPITLGRRITKMIGRSQSGNYLGNVVIGEDRATSVALQNLTASWYRAYMDPFVVAAQTAPFFFAWRPTSYPSEIGYAWLGSDPVPSNQRANGMLQIDLQLVGVA